VRLAKGRLPKSRMNKTEAEYANLFLAHPVMCWGFEEITLRLGDDCRYTPDFWVLNPDDDVLEFHEIKGHWRDDAKVKIRTASEKYPEFRFKAFRKDKMGWHVEPFGPEDAVA
jgi:hypothetical protein